MHTPCKCGCKCGTCRKQDCKCPCHEYAAFGAGILVQAAKKANKRINESSLKDILPIIRRATLDTKMNIKYYARDIQKACEKACEIKKTMKAKKHKKTYY